MELTVELKPHVGRMQTGIGIIDVEHGPWLVYVNGVHAGFVDKRPGFPVNLLATRQIPEQYKPMIEKKVEELLGHKTAGVATGAFIEEDDGEE